jgi:hypothetical protein
LLPPGYTSPVPEGYFVSRSRTIGNLMFFRTFLKEGDPKLGVDNVKRSLRVYPLSQAANPPPMKFVDISGKAFNTIGPSDYSLFEFVNRVVQNEPIDAVDPDTLGLFAAIGIEKGKPYAPDDRMKKILTEGGGGRRCDSPRDHLQKSDQRSLIIPEQRVGNAIHRRQLQVRTGWRGQPRRESHVLFLCHRRYTSDDDEDGRAGLAVRRRTPKVTPWTAAKRTDCTCRPTSLPRISGHSRCTITRHARCSRPINNRQP